MPKVKLHMLTALDIERATIQSGELILYDGGGLSLRVRPNNAKTWIFRFVSPITGIRKKLSLGSFPDTSLREARKSASDKRSLVSGGIDPVIEAEKNIINAKKILAEQKKQQGNIVETIFKKWIKEDLQNRKDKGSYTEAMFKKDVIPLLGNKPINEVDKEDINTVLNQPLARGSKRMANILLSDLKQFFG